MKKILFCLALAPLLSSCMSMLLDTRNLGEFSIIDNATPYDIHYYQGSSYSIKVHANQLDLPYIITRIVGGQLYVEYDKTHKFHGTPYVDVYSPSMAQYNGRGSGNFKAMTNLNMSGKDMQFNMSGSGQARMGQVTANRMNMNNTGSGDIRIKNGTVTGQNTINMGGSGNVRFNGTSQQTQVTNQGSGNVKGRIDGQSFSGQTTNSGSIRMKGNATTVTTEQKGTGTTEYKRTDTRASRSSTGTNVSAGSLPGRGTTTTRSAQTGTTTTRSAQTGTTTRTGRR